MSSINRLDMGVRLVEERTRLGYSQADFAHQTDVSRERLRLNETGRSGISAELLARAAQLGLDVQYVVTGIRSNNIKDVAEHTAPPAISGNNNNVLIGSGTINNIKSQKIIKAETIIKKTNAKVTPNEKHISDQMAATLKELVDQVVATEAKLKKLPKTHKAVWSSLNSHCKVPTYRLIALEDYPKAELYLRKWLGRLNASKSAPKKNNVDWRKRKYKYIHTNVRLFAIEATLHAYLQKNFSATSLTELDDTQLDKVYNYISSKKRSLKKLRVESSENE